MEYIHPEALVSTEWLEEHLNDDDVRIVDATAFIGDSERDADEEFGFRHIPGAVRFDVDEIADTASPLPHMLPDAETFAEAVRAKGLGDGKKVVFYDVFGGYCAAARAWWMFRAFGHDNVAVLDGGFPKWGKERRPLEQGEENPTPTDFTPKFRPELVWDWKQVLDNQDHASALLVDVRSSARYHGEQPEPRPSKRNGHIPKSINLPFPQLMNPKQDFMMRSADEIAAAIDGAAIDLDKPVVATCGSGMTACVLAFAAYLIGHEDMAVYDGSWAEWGDRLDLPAVTAEVTPTPD